MATNYTPAGYEDDSEDDDFFFESGGGFGGGASYPQRGSWPAQQSHVSQIKEEKSSKQDPKVSNDVSKEDGFLLGLSSAPPKMQQTLSGAMPPAAAQQGLALTSGWTPLMCACAKTDVDQIRNLLDDGSSPNEGHECFSPLMVVATATNCSEDRCILCTILLLDHSATVDTVDRHLMTPLMHAALRGQTGICKLLIDRGADVNKQESRGWTALMLACQNGFPQTINVLLASSADRSLCDYDGQRASDVAASHGNSYIASKLEMGAAQINVREAEDSWESSKDGVGYIKYDSLDTFVSGIGYGNLLHCFKDHQISFHDFLKMSDKDLCEIGVLDPVARRKILESIADVHTSEWNISNLTEDNFKKMNTFELATTLAKVGKYVRCLSSSVSFVRASLEKHPDDLQLDNAKQKKMFRAQYHESVSALASLNQEMKLLSHIVGKVIHSDDLKDVELIDGAGASTKRPWSTRRRLFAGCLLATVVGVAAVATQKPEKLQGIFDWDNWFSWIANKS